MALFGGNFEKQPVAAADTGIVWQKTLSDGILLGFGLSFSGSTLTVAPGYMLACGRLIGNNANLAVAVSGTSGYARVVLKIDLTGTATAETFSQVSVRVDYAASVEGFSALVQQEINDWTHTTYEAALCVLALGANGISEIVSNLDTAFPALPDGFVTAAKLGSDILPANVGIKHGTATPTTATLAPGEIYLKHS